MFKFILFSVILANVCIAQTFEKTQHPATYKGKQLIVGQITKGVRREYILLADGGVYRHLGTATDYERLGQQTSKNIKAVFNSLEEVKFAAIQFDHTIATKKSFFVIFKEGPKQHKVTWGDTKFKTPEGVERIYNAFMGMIPTNVRY
jgi:hypothetical protein